MKSVKPQLRTEDFSLPKTNIKVFSFLFYAFCLAKKRERSAGFSLIETLIYLAIIGIMAISLVNFSIFISDSRNKNYVAQEVHANSRIALNLISRTVRTASGINAGSSVFGSDPGVLSLAMSDPAKNPTIIDLSQNDGVLRITEGASAPVAITSSEVKVANLVFTNLFPDNIRIEMTVEFNNIGTDIDYIYSQTLQTAVSIRK